MTREVATAAEKEFHEKMHAAHMYGLWELASQMTRHPEPKAIPYMWKASLIESLVREAAEAQLRGAARPREPEPHVGEGAAAVVTAPALLLGEDLPVARRAARYRRRRMGRHRAGVHASADRGRAAADDGLLGPDAAFERTAEGAPPHRQRRVLRGAGPG